MTNRFILHYMLRTGEKQLLKKLIKNIMKYYKREESDDLEKMV